MYPLTRDAASLISGIHTREWRPARSCLGAAFSREELSLDVGSVKDRLLPLLRALLALGPGVTVDMAGAAARLSLDVLGVAKLGYDFGAVAS